MVEAQGASKIQVAETGNKRQAITDEDVLQTIKDMAAWFQTNATAHYEAKMAPVKDQASQEQTDALLAAFSAGNAKHLGMSLQKFNGGIQYEDTFIGLSVDEISSAGAGLADRKIVPFARDIDGQLLCVQMGDDGSESVIGYDPSDGQIEQKDGLTYGQYLESISQKILTKKLVYEEGLGLVQVA